MSSGLRIEAKDPSSRFLPLRDLNVLVSEGEPGSLGWLGPEELSRVRVATTPLFMGLLDGVAYFAIDVSNAGGRTGERCVPVRGCAVGYGVANGRGGGDGGAGAVAGDMAQPPWVLRHLRAYYICEAGRAGAAVFRV